MTDMDTMGLSTASELFAGIDVGGTAIKYGIVDAHGEIVRQGTTPTKAELGVEATVASIVDVAQALCASTPRVASLGIGVPGVVHPETYVVQNPPNLPGWDIVPLRDIVRQAVPVPVSIANDANAAAIAEAMAGAGRELGDFLYVTLGTGIGGGVIMNHRLHTGPFGDAGEIGHIIVDIHDMPTQEQIDRGLSFRAGTMEEMIGRHGVLATWSRLSGRTGDDVEDISAFARNGDALALRCLEHVGTVLGTGLASALAVLGMVDVIIGGGIAQAHPILLEATLKTIRERAIPTISRRITIRPATFGTTSGLVGAAMIGKYGRIFAA